MNNKVIKSFLLRCKEGPSSPDGRKSYREDFYINQQPPTDKNRCLLHCFAYGETVWYGKYKFRRPYDAFKNYKYGDEHWSFDIVVSGDGVLNCDKVRYKIKPNNVFILRPGKQISLQAGPSRLLQKRSLLMKSPLLKYICDSGGLAGIDYIESQDSSRLLHIFDRIKTIILNQEEYWQQDISNECYAFLCALNQMAQPLQYPPALHQALNIINADPYQDYDLPSLCRQCGVSVSTLSRLFKRHLNTSPVNYIIDRRLEQAKRLLSISDMSLKEIAERCGYRSQSFLSRSFKNKFGMYPSKFRLGR